MLKKITQYFQIRSSRTTGAGGRDWTEEQKLVWKLMDRNTPFVRGQNMSDGGFQELDDERAEAEARQLEEALNQLTEATPVAANAESNSANLDQEIDTSGTG